MKLKSILIIAMVAIMAIAGAGVTMAATITTTTTNSTDSGGTSFGRVPNLGANFTCVGAAVGVNVTCTINGAAYATDASTGSGTGMGAMPTQVFYNKATGEYSFGTADATTGYLLNQNLFGMCGTACSLFVPEAAVTAAGANTAGLLIANGGGTPAQGGTIPVGTGAFDQAVFTTGLVSGFDQSGVGGQGLKNVLSQFTQHTSSNVIGTVGDFIDQRLAMALSATAAGTTNVVLNQSVFVGITLDMTGSDPTWVGNVNPFANDNCGVSAVNGAGCAPYGNTGQIAQQLGDNISNTGTTASSIDIGSYGQLFNNITVETNNLTPGPAPAAAPGTTYAPLVGPSSVP